MCYAATAVAVNRKLPREKIMCTNHRLIPIIDVIQQPCNESFERVSFADVRRDIDTIGAFNASILYTEEMINNIAHLP